MGGYRISKLRPPRVGQATLLGGSTAAALAVEYLADRSLTPSQTLRGLAVAALVGVAVAVREWRPLLLLLVTDAAILARAFLPPGGDGVAWGLVSLLAVYSAATRAEGREAALGLVLTATLVAGIIGYDRGNQNLGGIFFFGLLGGTPWIFGRLIRRRRLREAELDRARRAAEAAVVEERARVARELHDVVGHALGVITLQAEGAGRLLAEDPEEVAAALAAIASTSRDALVEMRRLVALLRASDDAPGRAPAPGLARLQPLVEHVRAAGLPVELVIEGEPRPLPAGIDLSAFRIVQEGLTNALKHAGQATATVCVRYGEDELVVEVLDSGSSTPPAESTAGHGLVGMRERVGLYGGRLEAGTVPGEGYALRASLPLRPGTT